MMTGFKLISVLVVWPLFSISIHASQADSIKNKQSFEMRGDVVLEFTTGHSTEAYRVKLRNEDLSEVEVDTHLSGRMKKQRKVNVKDCVVVEMTRYDLTNGRIIAFCDE